MKYILSGYVMLECHVLVQKLAFVILASYKIHTIWLCDAKMLQACFVILASYKIHTIWLCDARMSCDTSF
jgi:hypothetical protein